MAGVHIVCDSTADLDRAYRGAHEVRVVPLKVIFGDEVLADGEDIDAPGFYRRLRTSKTHPRTSQPTPAEFEAAFRDLGSDGGTVICTTISADLSGSFASAQQARAAPAGCSAPCSTSNRSSSWAAASSNPWTGCAPTREPSRRWPTR